MPSAHDFPLENLPDSPQSASGRISSSTTEDVSFLRLPEVKLVTGLSKSSLYALIRAKRFPAPVQLGPRTVAWVRSEIKQWAAERITASRTAVPSSSPKRSPQRVSEPWPAVKKWA
jgi:prophage regulatory protein